MIKIMSMPVTSCLYGERAELMLMRTIPLDISHVAKFICDRGGEILLSSIVGILSPSFSIKLQKVLALILLLSLMMS